MLSRARRRCPGGEAARPFWWRRLLCARRRCGGGSLSARARASPAPRASPPRACRCGGPARPGLASALWPRRARLCPAAAVWPPGLGCARGPGAVAPLAPRAAPLLFPRGFPGPQGRAASRARSARAVSNPAAPLFPSGLRPSWRRGPCSGGGRARGRRALGPGACLALARRARPPAPGLAPAFFIGLLLPCRPPMRSQAARAACPRPLRVEARPRSCRAALGRQGRS